ncbi:DNA polymerase epsilon subunit C isoform X1 [Abrus precatorius]|uniref:DNA polymerase epsilon subunit C isoform X1 n=1 Tax=Abrus precatorius TaxID=3816 RepID=A0A8B8KUK1_ABRPR|nr:DNA polymerase epsilon subunit C isoform X1 [Abrus precatorius]
MASSNNPKSEKKKIKNREISITKSKSKTKKDRDLEKEKENKKKNNKKLKLSNGKSKRQEEEEQVGGDEEEAKTHVFPMNRIRTMIKGEDLRASQEALLAINKATVAFYSLRFQFLLPIAPFPSSFAFSLQEKFLEQFTQDAYAGSVQDRKKSLNYKHLACVVSKQRRYDFLSDFVPEKVRAEDALRERNSGGNGGG